MEGINHKVVNKTGAEVGTVALDTRIFGVKVNPHVVFEAVQSQLAERRQGTHSCLTKGAMKGGGKKPWRQKGTGRARAGSSTSPIWVGGGVAHGPKPRSYSNRAAKRLRTQALLAVLSEWAAQNRLVVIDSLDESDPVVKGGKTKDFAALLKGLGLYGKKVALLTPSDGGMGLLRVARNIRGMYPLAADRVSAYDLMRCDCILCGKNTLESLQEKLKGRELVTSESSREPQGKRLA